MQAGRCKYNDDDMYDYLPVSMHQGTLSTCHMMHDDQMNKKMELDSNLGPTPGSWPNPLEQVK